MSSPSLTAKYRPQRFGDVAGQEAIKRILSKASAEDKIAPAYLFSGTRGVGKTTLARVLAKALNCVTAPTGEPCNECVQCRQITAGISPDVIEIDAATHGNVEEARRLKEDIGYAPLQSRYKVFIIDEAHMLSKAAFNALLKTLEEPPGRVTFVLATTEPHKILPTIISRCQHYIFKRLTQPELEAHLVSLLEREGVPFESSALSILARRGAGSVRDSMSLLAQVLASGGATLTEQDVRDILGLAGQDVFFSLMQAFEAQDCLAVAEVLRVVLDRGLDIGFFLRELSSCWRNMFILKQAGEKALGSLEMSEEEGRRWLEWAGRFEARNIHACWQMTLEGQRRVMTSLEPALALELLLLNLAYLPQLISLENLGAPPASSRPGPGGPGAPRQAPMGAASGNYGAPAGGPSGNYGAPSGGPGGAQGAPYGAPGAVPRAAAGAPGSGYGAPVGTSGGNPSGGYGSSSGGPSGGYGTPAGPVGGNSSGGHGASTGPIGGSSGGPAPAPGGYGQAPRPQGGSASPPWSVSPAPSGEDRSGPSGFSGDFGSHSRPGGPAPSGPDEYLSTRPGSPAPSGPDDYLSTRPGGPAPSGPDDYLSTRPGGPAPSGPDDYLSSRSGSPAPQPGASTPAGQGYGGQPGQSGQGYGQSAPPAGGFGGQGRQASEPSYGEAARPQAQEHRPSGPRNWTGFHHHLREWSKTHGTTIAGLPILKGEIVDGPEGAVVTLKCHGQAHHRQLSENIHLMGLLRERAVEYFGQGSRLELDAGSVVQAKPQEDLRAEVAKEPLFQEAVEKMGGHLLYVKPRS